MSLSYPALSPAASFTALSLSHSVSHTSIPTITTNSSLPSCFFASSLSRRPSSPSHPPPPFYFRRRHLHFNWALLNAVDLEAIVNKTDLDALQRSIDSLTFSDFTTQELSGAPLSQVLALIRLFQLSLEYLLHCQSCLVKAGIEREKSADMATKSVVEERRANRDKLKERDAEIVKLRKQNALLNTAVNIYQEGEEPLRIDNAQSKERQREQRRQIDHVDKDYHHDSMNGEIFYCTKCTAAFISAGYLSSHMHRRHPGSSKRVTGTSPSKEEADRTRLESALQEKMNAMRLEMARSIEKERDTLQREWHREMVHHKEVSELKEKHMMSQSHSTQQSPTKADDLGSQDMKHAQISVQWLQKWQCEMQQMMEQKLSSFYVAEQSRQQAATLARLDTIQERLGSFERSRQHGELLTIVRTELGAMRQEALEMVDTRAQRWKESTEQSMSVMNQTAHFLYEQEKDQENKKRKDLEDMLVQTRDRERRQSDLLNELEHERDEAKKETNRQKAALLSLRDKCPTYPVLDSFPYLLARFPHTPNKMNSFINNIESKVNHASQEAKEEYSCDITAENEIEQSVDRLVETHWTDSDEELQHRQQELEQKEAQLRKDQERVRREHKREQRRLQKEQAFRADLRLHADSTERQQEQLQKNIEGLREEEKADLNQQIKCELFEMGRMKKRQADEAKEVERKKSREMEKNRNQVILVDSEDDIETLSSSSNNNTFTSMSESPTVYAPGRQRLVSVETRLDRASSNISLLTPAFDTHVEASTGRSPSSSVSTPSSLMPLPTSSLSKRKAALFANGFSPQQLASSTIVTDDLANNSSDHPTNTTINPQQASITVLTHLHRPKISHQRPTHLLAFKPDANSPVLADVKVSSQPIHSLNNSQQLAVSSAIAPEPSQLAPIASTSLQPNSSLILTATVPTSHFPAESSLVEEEDWEF